MSTPSWQGDYEWIGVAFFSRSFLRCPLHPLYCELNWVVRSPNYSARLLVHDTTDKKNIVLTITIN